MSDTYCGAKCDECNSKNICKGCVNTCGSPFGGRCAAAEYIKKNGLKAYTEFKAKLKDEINGLLEAERLPAVDDIYELAGNLVNLRYTMQNGEKVRFLNDNDVYIGGMVNHGGAFYGAVTDGNVMILSKFDNGTDAELLLYKKRG